MGIFEILLIALGVSMDAFAVSICKGISMQNLNIKKTLIISLYFGIFQALMPLIGYFFGSRFQNFVINIDHWIAFVLLGFIGINMIKESKKKDDNDLNDDTSFKTMSLLAVATSIDALAVGITFAFFKVNICIAILIIGIVAFLISLIGVFIGKKFGNKYENKAEIFGGIVLIIIGLKILIQHLKV